MKSSARETDSFLACVAGAPTARIPNCSTSRPAACANRWTLPRCKPANNMCRCSAARSSSRPSARHGRPRPSSRLSAANLQPSDVAWMVPHQANKRIIDAAARQLAVPSERVLVNVDKYGNTSSASIPIDKLSESFERGLLRDGDVLLLVISAVARLGARSSGVGPPRENRCNLPGTRVAAHWDGC